MIELIKIISHWIINQRYQHVCLKSLLLEYKSTKRKKNYTCLYRKWHTYFRPECN